MYLEQRYLLYRMQKIFQGIWVKKLT